MTWSRYDTAQTLLTLLLTVAVLLAVRALILHLLEGNFDAPRVTPQRMAPRTRAFSHNPIVVRESMRAARRGWGGVVGLYVRRYALLATYLALSLCEPYLFPAGGLLLWTVILAIAATAWGTLSALQEERPALEMVRVSGLSAREYVRGWLHWSLRYRALEVFVITALFTLSAVLDTCLGGSASEVEAASVTLGILTALGAAVFLQSAVAVCVAISASRRAGGWLTTQVRVLGCLIPSLLIAALPVILVVFAGILRPLSVFFLFGVAPLVLSACCLAVAWHDACRAVEM